LSARAGTQREAFRFSDTGRAHLEDILGDAAARVVPDLATVAGLARLLYDTEEADPFGTVTRELGRVQTAMLPEMRAAELRAIGPAAAQALVVAEILVQLEQTPMYQRRDERQREDLLWDALLRHAAREPHAAMMLTEGYARAIVGSSKAGAALLRVVARALERGKRKRGGQTRDTRERLVGGVAWVLRAHGVPCKDYDAGPLSRTLEVVLRDVGDPVMAAPPRNPGDKVKTPTLDSWLRKALAFLKETPPR
jgi:hypothetical protein